MHSEHWGAWAVGVLVGVLSAILAMAGTFLMVGIALLNLAFVAVRSLAFLSGAFMGFGLAWITMLALTANATAGMLALLGVSGAVVIAGSVTGLIAWRRRGKQLTHRDAP